MHNYDTNPISGVSERSNNLSIAETCVNEAIYHEWVPAELMEDAQLTTAATYVAATAIVPAHWLLADGVRSGVSFYMRRRGPMITGSVRVDFHYSVSVGGGNLALSVSALACMPGVAWQSASYTDFTKAAGSVADAPYLESVIESGLSISSQIDTKNIGSHVVFRRVGNSADDTNTGDMSIYGLDVIYTEAKRQVGDKFAR